jgi:hypothetical protein
MQALHLRFRNRRSAMHAVTRPIQSAALAALLLGSSVMTASADETKKPAAPMPDCSSAKHQKLRMLLGEWTVTEDGKVVGHNTLTPVYVDCAVREEWKSASGSEGTSLTFYDSQLDIYRQTWIDSNGIVLELSGRFEGDSLVLEGKRPSTRDPGTTVDNRITWTPNEGGGFQQVWTVSNDGGKSWKRIFNGKYAK